MAYNLRNKGTKYSSSSSSSNHQHQLQTEPTSQTKQQQQQQQQTQVNEINSMCQIEDAHQETVKLPLEIWFKIVQYISQRERITVGFLVSWMFKGLVAQSFHLEGININDLYIARSVTKHIPFEAFEKFMYSISGLHSLNLDETSVNIISLQKIISLNSTLKTLSVSKCHNFKLAELFRFIPLLPLLEHLSAAFDEKGIIVINYQHFHLRYLDISNPTNTTTVSKVEVSSIVSAFPNLTTLSLNWCNLKDESINLISSLSRLENLFLEASLISTKSVKELFLGNCSKSLQGLNLSFIQFLDGDQVIQSITEYCTNLSHLEMSMAPTTHTHCIKNIFDQYNNTLRFVDFGECISNFSNVIEPDKMYPQLHTLKLNNTAHLGEDFIQKILTQCPNLEEIHLRYCGGILSLRPLSQLKNLKHLELKAVRTTTDSIDFDLIEIANKCEKLEFLEIQHEGLTFRALEEIMKKCLNLNTLHFLSVRKVGLFYDFLIPANTSLTFLNLTECELDIEWVEYFLSTCLNLKNLEVSHEQSIAINQETLKEEFPRVNITIHDSWDDFEGFDEMDDNDEYTSEDEHVDESEEEGDDDDLDEDNDYIEEEN